MEPPHTYTYTHQCYDLVAHLCPFAKTIQSRELKALNVSLSTQSMWASLTLSRRLPASFPSPESGSRWLMAHSTYLEDELFTWQSINHLDCHLLHSFSYGGFWGQRAVQRKKINTWSNVKQSATKSILASNAVSRKITSVHLCLYLTMRMRFTEQDGSRTTLTSEVP